MGSTSSQRDACCQVPQAESLKPNPQTSTCSRFYPLVLCLWGLHPSFCFPPCAEGHPPPQASSSEQSNRPGSRSRPVSQPLRGPQRSGQLAGAWAAACLSVVCLLTDWPEAVICGETEQGQQFQFAVGSSLPSKVEKSSSSFPRAALIFGRGTPLVFSGQETQSRALQSTPRTPGIVLPR